MQNTLLAGLLGTCVLFSGCAFRHTEAPVPTNFAYQTQNKLQAASHWQLIAKDTAAQLIRALPDRKPLYIEQPSQQSPFERAFTHQLITELSTAGFAVMKHAQYENTLTVTVEAAPTRFSPDRLKSDPRWGRRTILTTGLWALGATLNQISPVETAAATGVVAGAATWDSLDWLRSEFAKGPVPQTELIVTTSVSNRHQYFVRHSGAYYTTDNDWSLYAKTFQLPSVALQLKGDHQ